MSLPWVSSASGEALGLRPGAPAGRAGEKTLTTNSPAYPETAIVHFCTQYYHYRVYESAADIRQIRIPVVSRGMYPHLRRADKKSKMPNHPFVIQSGNDSIFFIFLLLYLRDVNRGMLPHLQNVYESARRLRQIRIRGNDSLFHTFLMIVRKMRISGIRISGKCLLIVACGY